MHYSLQVRNAMRLTFFISFILILNSYSDAQKFIFTPVPVDSLQLASLEHGYEKIYQQEIADLPILNKKDLSELYNHRWDNVKEKFEKKEIYTSAPVQQYLDALVAEIVKSNPELHANTIHCYFSRSGIPNASYIGEGIILFNMGLFDKLNNESQAVFVLCHEMSHFLLKHGENSISKYVTTLNSEQVQKQLRNIKATEFGKRSQLEKLLKGLTFDSRRHGRDHESEADSMAVELMRHTRFDLSQGLTALALLDSVDLDAFKTDVCLQAMFNAKQYPFQKKWLAKEEGLLGGHATFKEDKALSDSLKTHPDCKSRVKYLEPLVKKYQPGNPTIIANSAKFTELQNIFSYEVVEFAFLDNNYTRSLQYTLGMLQKYPSDPYLITQVGRILNGFYQADKMHTLGKITDLPSPYTDPNYNLLLQFVQNLYRENFAAINYHYLGQYQEQLKFYQPYKTAYNLSAQFVKQ